MALARRIGDLAAKKKLIPGDNARLVEAMATAVNELMESQNYAREEAAIGNTGLRGSQEYRWVAVGPEARQKREEWMRHLDTDAQRISPFQRKWDQQQLVLSHNGSGWAVGISNGGVDVRETSGRASPDQPKQGTGTSSARVTPAGGSQGRTRIEPSTWARGMRSDDTPVRIVTLTVPTLSSVDSLLIESQKWSSENLINLQILMDEGPWRGTDMIVAWGLYFLGKYYTPKSKAPPRKQPCNRYCSN